jgi:Zn-dependent peptidase ImmA (M78 family)/transcriptional regulator with XRE-family HTH domain
MSYKEENLFSVGTLNWAVGRTKLDIQKLSKKLNVSEDKIKMWLNGELQPTFGQAKKLANAAHVTFLELLLDNPPEFKEDLPDFRTLDSKPLKEASSELEDIIDYVKTCQNWYRDYAQDNELKISDFCGCIKGEIDTTKVADILSKKLQIEKNRKKSRNKDAFCLALSNRAEELGVCVMRGSFVKTANKRHLDPKEFRAFALSDKYAPFIFINTKDSKAAQIFSLTHELVHIANGDSGLTGSNFDSEKEKFANEVAGKILIPDEFVVNWKLDQRDHLLNEAEKIAKPLKVSSWAVLTRLLTLRKISKIEYKDAVDYIKSEVLNIKFNKKGGPDYYVMRKMLFGKNLSQAIINAAKSGDLMYRDMNVMFGIKAKNFDRFVKAVGPASVEGY